MVWFLFAYAFDSWTANDAKRADEFKEMLLPYRKPTILEDKSTRFPETPMYGPNGNQSADFGPEVGDAIGIGGSSQSLADKEVVASDCWAGWKMAGCLPQAQVATQARKVETMRKSLS
ncbi:MAG: hypothetical protein SFU86_14680 [Pirellulaceae bacterium]|nr:hypothetical protein [Pirellulaceae bacterium]